MKGHHLWVLLAIAFMTAEACGRQAGPSSSVTAPSGATSVGSVGSSPSGVYTMSGFVRRTDFARTPLANATVQDP